ncbi:hypothetical protein AVEN_78029-1 [Araneus ventricosus]|uniref:Uncharacterized protein n=1 Tax=Araneus ventricosus TaxID=182803 RepID=A0A4Y2FRL8_ARAVE|nr:hypothetical protein AVEN_78029-1 [Araneus ventricosus]
MAVSKLLAMENKFKCDSEFEKEYKCFMKEYEEAGHMSPNKGLDSSKIKCFLPHHAVQKKDSITTRLFDPLGFLSPCTILIKIFYRQLWLLKLNWDNALPEHFAIKWHKFQREFQQIYHISIPRWLRITEKEIALHGFSDASESTYAYLICAVQRNDYGVTKVTILAAKSKVAPLKPVSIPRLELNEALLLAGLFSVLTNTLKDHVTDSQVVLSWLSSPPRSWKPFIANSTSEILDLIP